MHASGDTVLCILLDSSLARSEEPNGQVSPHQTPTLDPRGPVSLAREIGRKRQAIASRLVVASITGKQGIDIRALVGFILGLNVGLTVRS